MSKILSPLASSFPLDHISYSSMVKFSTNPILFKIQYINRQQFETTTNVAGVVGKAFHAGMEAYYNEKSVEKGLEVAVAFLTDYNDGFINYSTTIENKQDAIDKVVFAYNSYVQTAAREEELIACEDKFEENIDIEWRGQQITLPIKLKGFLDRVVRDEKKRLCIRDYKTCVKFSEADKIDGAKILQAVEYYFGTYAKYGEEPYSFEYEEVKTTKNRDGSPQVRRYEIVYADNELYFDFYLRFYEDMIRAINGEQVFVPNVSAMYDNEISIVAYVQRLDVEDEVAKRMAQNKVTNVTDLLKKDIQKATNMKSLLRSVEKTFMEAKNINYEAMKTEEKVQTKMLEHGIALKFDSIIEGASVDLYRYHPSIGLKMSRLRNYADDVEQVLGVTGVRILAPIQNSTMVGFEVPRKERRFAPVPSGKGFDIAIGQDIMGDAYRFDIRTAPHMLVAGASGSGKSFFLNALIEQLSRIPNSELHLFDPKRVELSQHKGKAAEYKSDIEEIHDALERLEEEMQRRYEQMEAAGVRNKDALPELPYKFVIIDEFGELIAAKHVKTEYKGTGQVYSRGENIGEEKMEKITTDISGNISNKILRLAQLARAAGIHLIIATQRPSTDIITGTIKANFPTKVAFRTSNQVDSRVILDDSGAEKLLGKGDMLFLDPSRGDLQRLQGFYL